MSTLQNYLLNAIHYLKLYNFMSWCIIWTHICYPFILSCISNRYCYIRVIIKTEMHCDLQLQCLSLDLRTYEIYCWRFLCQEWYYSWNFNHINFRDLFDISKLKYLWKLPQATTTGSYFFHIHISDAHNFTTFAHRFTECLWKEIFNSSICIFNQLDKLCQDNG